MYVDSNVIVKLIFMMSYDVDLLLAAEIGKTLLEKNRELEIVLKSTQDFAEEKAAQADVSIFLVEL